jgi:alcohol dehydrogenase class IV
MYESKVNINEVFELRASVKDYFGVGAIHKIDDIAKEMLSKGIDKVIVISGRHSYKACGAWDVIEASLKKHNIGYINFAKVTPNPTDTAVDEATKIALDFGAKAVIGIGGGSPIDTAKSVATMMEYPENKCSELYEGIFTPTKAAPILAINTTHGTGTEVNRFAVVTITSKDYKPAIAYDCLYPTWAIDDPGLMVNLPLRQTLYVSIDAVNHVTESATTTVASPYSILTAQETIRLVNKYLPIAKEDLSNLEARYFLTYASALGGISFDNGLLHFTHALEHPLSAIKPELAHGLGLSMILPAVLETIYPACPEVLADIYAPIVPNLKGLPEEAHEFAKGVEQWLFSMGVTQKLSDEGFSEKDIDKLVTLVNETPSLGGLLAIAPVKATDDIVRKIYSSSLYPMK